VRSDLASRRHWALVCGALACHWHHQRPEGLTGPLPDQPTDSPPPALREALDQRASGCGPALNVRPYPWSAHDRQEARTVTVR
jgi:hypothetical protein